MLGKQHNNVLLHNNPYLLKTNFLFFFLNYLNHLISGALWESFKLILAIIVSKLMKALKKNFLESITLRIFRLFPISGSILHCNMQRIINPSGPVSYHQVFAVLTTVFPNPTDFSKVTLHFVSMMKHQKSPQCMIKALNQRNWRNSS